MNQKISGNALATLLLAPILPGCLEIEPDEPPLFAFDKIRYWFEGDLLVLNITMTNRGNFTPGPPNSPYPSLSFIVTTRKNDKSGGRIGEELDWIGFRMMSLHFSPFDNPPDWRWHDLDTIKKLGKPHSTGLWGPIALYPNMTINMEFGFLPHQEYRHGQGYYDIKIEMIVKPTYHGVGSDTRYQSGCFNHDVDEFYAVKDGYPSCNFYNSAGRDTMSGVAVWGREQAGVPLMIRDPPSDVEGAH